MAREQGRRGRGTLRERAEAAEPPLDLSTALSNQLVP